MRRIMMLAAMLATLGMAPQPAEAGERGFGVRHVSPHAGAKFHRPHHRFDVHRRDVFGKHRHVKPRHFAQPGFVLKFSTGGFAFKFGDLPRFKPRHLHHGHGRGGVVSRFGHSWHLQPWHLQPWHHRGSAFSLHRPDVRPDPGRSVDGGSDSRSERDGVAGHMRSPGILEQLEALGFREVPRLLEERGYWARLSTRQPAAGRGAPVQD